MRANTVFQRGPGMVWITEDQCEELHSAAMDILDRIGCLVNNKESIDLLRKGGAKIQENRAFIPSALVEKALATVPHHFTVYSRQGEPAMYLEPNRVYFGSGSDTQYTLDIYTGERRPSVKQDAANIALLTDALEELDFVMSMALPSDCSRQRYHNHQGEQMILNSTKPFIFTAEDRQDVEDALEMCQCSPLQILPNSLLCRRGGYRCLLRRRPGRDGNGQERKTIPIWLGKRPSIF